MKHRDFLKVNQVLRLIRNAVEQRKPFSLVRVGDGENLILAQNSVMPIKEVLSENWSKAANQGKKGVTLPNLKLRNEMVKALKKADVIGIPFWNGDPIIAEQRIKRPLSEAVFQYFKIRPKRTCHTFVNRVFTQKRRFWRILKGRRIILIGDWGESVKPILQKEPYKLNIVFVQPFSNYGQMEKVLKVAIQRQHEFDIALVSCGVNAVVLTQKIAESTGKVAIDFGKSLMFMVQNKAGLEHSSHQAFRDMLP